MKKEYVQVAILDSGGLEVLTNLLDTEDHKCRIGSLKILREITIHPEIRKQITLMGGVEPTIVILSEPYKDQQLIATETLANLAQFRRARNIFRRHGGIPKLVDLLDVDQSKVRGNIFLHFFLQILSSRVSFFSLVMSKKYL